MGNKKFKFVSKLVSFLEKTIYSYILCLKYQRFMPSGCKYVGLKKYRVLNNLGIEAEYRLIII